MRGGDLAGLLTPSLWTSAAGVEADAADAADAHLLDPPGTLLLAMTRRRLLRFLPNAANVAEIGVARGSFATLIRAICRPRHLLLVDPWREQDRATYFGDSNNVDAAEHERRFADVSRRFASERAGRTCRVLRMTSGEAAADVPDASLDWVYVDANHGHDACLADLRLWSAKVKPDGLICGHDFATHASARAARFGVVEAVRAFVCESGADFTALTLEPFPSFVLAKSPQGETRRTLRRLLLANERHLVQVNEMMLADMAQALITRAGRRDGTLMALNTLGRQPADR